MLVSIFFIIIFLCIIIHENIADEKYMIGLSAHDIGSITCNDATKEFYVKAIDLDSDGFIDILLNCIGTGKIYWYKNDGYQHFTEYLIGDVGNEVNDFTMADINNDGLIDVVGVSKPNDKAVWFQNNGGIPVTFTASTIRDGGDGDDQLKRVIAHDFNKDGDVDIVTGGNNGNEIEAWQNNGGSIGGTRIFTSRYTSNENNVFSMSLADFNRDDWMDFVMSEKDNGIYWYRNKKTTTINFDQFRIRWNGYVGNEVRSLFAMDIDGDNITDVVTCDRNTNKIYWIKNGNILLLF
jgi:hypothetical protein